MFRRLAGVLKISTRRVRCPVVGLGTLHLARIPCDVKQQIALLPYANVTVSTNVNRDVQFYIAERQNAFPGVEVQQVYLRNYPLHGLAAQLFGTVGPINAVEVKQKAYRGISQNAIIGQSGLEASYDRYLRGTDGAERVQVDSLGQPTGDLSKTAPVPGHNLALSLDVNIQRTGQSALQQSIDSNYPANGGAFVAMNPQDGSVYAMGSLPTFDPNVFTSNLSQSQYNKLISAGNNYPLLNRAIDSAGPTGSTFKPITATAALQSGNWTTSSTLRRHGFVLHLPRGLPPQRRRGEQRAAGPGQRDPRLVGHLLLQPRRADQHRRPPGSPRRWPAPALGPQLRHRSEDRHRRSRRAGGHASVAPLACQPRQARARVRAGPGSLQGAPQAGVVRDRGRPPVVDRRQHQPRRRPGRCPGDADAAGGGLLRDRQRRHGRPPPRRAQHRESGRDRAAEDRSAALASHFHQPASTWRRSAPACGRPRPSRAVPRLTSSPTFLSRSTARPAPPSTTASRTTRGTPASSPPRRRASRSWSW